MNVGFDTPGAAPDLQEQLIAALRDELAEYGGLLQLLGLQQTAVL